LNQSEVNKEIILYAEKGDEMKTPIIIKLSKNAFPSKDDEKLVNDLLSDLSGNDSEFLELKSNPFLNSVKATVIYPATQKLINKYTHKNKIIVKETAEIYKNIVLPYLKNSQNSNQWIYNILEGKSEQERTIFHDKDPEIGFLLAPSMNWPGEIETLYLNTLTMDRNIMSIRDLRKNHLKLLKHMRDKTLEICQKNYNLSKNELRIYFHYQPSFYHLHLHIVNVNFRPGGMDVGRAILLDDVIYNLEMDGEFYEKVTLVYGLDEDSELLGKICAYLN